MRVRALSAKPGSLRVTIRTADRPVRSTGQ
jgi:hypothetical protein